MSVTVAFCESTNASRPSTRAPTSERLKASISPGLVLVSPAKQKDSVALYNQMGIK